MKDRARGRESGVTLEEFSSQIRFLRWREQELRRNKDIITRISGDRARLGDLIKRIIHARVAKGVTTTLTPQWHVVMTLSDGVWRILQNLTTTGRSCLLIPPGYWVCQHFLPLIINIQGWPKINTRFRKSSRNTSEDFLKIFWIAGWGYLWLWSQAVMLNFRPRQAPSLIIWEKWDKCSDGAWRGLKFYITAWLHSQR